MTADGRQGARRGLPRLLRSLASALLKLALSAGLIWWAASQADLGAMAARVGRVDWLWLVPLVLLLLAQAGLLCMRFRWVLLGAEGRKRPAWPVARTVLAGLLFNQPFPSTLGGDVARVVLLRRMGVPLGTAFSAVVADRGAALLAMLLAMTATLPLMLAPAAALAPSHRATVLWTDLGGAAVALAVLAFLGLVRSLRVLARLHRLLARLAGIYTSVRAGLFGARRLPWILLAGLAGHMLTALFGVCVAAGLGIPLPLAAALLLIPPVLLVAQVPLSIAGWGVREAAMVTALGFVGLPPADALLVSVGIGLATLAQGLVAGLVWSLAGARAARRAAGSAAVAVAVAGAPAGKEREDVAAPLEP